MCVDKAAVPVDLQLAIGHRNHGLVVGIKDHGTAVDRGDGQGLVIQVIVHAAVIVTIVVVDDQIATDAAAFIHGVTVCQRNRDVIHWRHANIHDNGICAALAVTDDGGKAVTAVVVGIRDVGPAAIGVDHDSTVGGIGAFAEGQGVIVGIGRQQGAVYRSIFRRGHIHVAAQRGHRQE